jgi:hypothetical protein
MAYSGIVDKVMPLDLSCGRPNDAGNICDDNDSDVDGDKDDEIIVTLAIPGRQDAARHCQTDPIVIPSDSEDSDSDVTILTDVDGKNGTFGEVLGIPIAGPSDDGDCFVSSFQRAPKCNTSKKCFPGGAHAGIKRIYEDSSSQSSVESLDLPIGGSLVQGKDPFLSDASSGDDIGLVLPSVDVKKASAFSLIKQSSTPLSQSTTNDQFDVSHSIGVKLDLSKSPMTSSAGGQTDAMLSVASTCIGLDIMPTKTVASLFSSASSGNLTFGITQLLQPQPGQIASHNAAVSADTGSPCFLTATYDRLCTDRMVPVTTNTGLVVGHTLPSLRDSTSMPASSATATIASSFPPSPHVPGTRKRTTSRALKLPLQSACNSGDAGVNGSSSWSAADAGKGWTVQSKGDCKVLLRRSLSCAVPSKTTFPTVSTSTTGTPCKRRRRLSVDASVTDSFVASSVVSSGTVADSDNSTQNLAEISLCYGCRRSIPVSQLSYCMAGHGCCGQCLQTQVKTLLASGKKGTLKCRYTACMSFYLVSQLHNSLPSMVVEILEEKLDREYCDNAAKLMLKAVGKDLLGAFSDDDFDEHGSDMSNSTSSRSLFKENCSILDIPKNWEPMAAKEEYRLVELVRCGSEEYNWVAALFHQSMTRPRAQITKIQRVQNQILWQFYMVKKKQMERDSNRPIVEKHLFHGTCRNVLDAICRYNFDWRLCGAHGTMYGQGSYFARDAAYSHMYTDQPPSRAASHHHSQPPPGLPQSAMVFNVPPPGHHQMAPTPQTSAAAATQMLFQAFPGSSHAVSIAALHSCRFAHLQGALLNPMPSTSSSTVAAAPPSFPMSLSSYWLGPSSVQPSSHTQTTAAAATSSSASSSSHVHTMFLARVLVGDYTTGKNMFRKPPPVDPSQPFGRCYDSCVNDPSNPSIFVIFNNSQCYPEYIIEYTNKPRDSL